MEQAVHDAGFRRRGRFLLGGVRGGAGAGGAGDAGTGADGTGSTMLIDGFSAGPFAVNENDFD